ncbi:MAG: hypothetical protein IKD33_06425, partial [Bacteroidales bacterium]|nr:hypothetical protein [Bacteroidales bacterium]
LSKDKGQKSKVEGQNSYHLACGPVDSLTCSLKTTGYRPAQCSMLKAQNCPANPKLPYLRTKSAMVSPPNPHSFIP